MTTQLETLISKEVESFIGEYINDPSIEDRLMIEAIFLRGMNFGIITAMTIKESDDE